MAPFYPVAFVIGWMIALLTESAASVHVLFRPLLWAVVLVVVVQLAASWLLKDRHLGAIVALLIELIILGPLPAALAVATILALTLAIAVGQRRTVRSMPWPTATRGLNLVSVILLGLLLANALSAGALQPPERLVSSSRGPSETSLPDVYLVLLDGHPRWDTLAHDFAHDSEPFVQQMSALGFQISRQSHANYNGTELTLSSMFNATQVADLPEVTPRPPTLAGQVRALTQAINHARALEAFRAEGYEMVTVPSSISSVTLYGADRIIDSGQMSSFELDVLGEGTIPKILPDLQRTWLIDQHRDRILAAFDALAELAEERVDHPRFVFAHLLAPHAPIAFGPAGEPRYGWPCFPVSCSMFDGGQIYGDAALGPIRDEVAYLEARMVDTARQIQARSARPPVIIFFSDHGSRHDFDDRDEMLRSLFIAATPGHEGLFPGDVTPINALPRLLNAYAGTTLPFAGEESYLVDMRTVGFSTGLLDFSRWSAPAPVGD